MAKEIDKETCLLHIFVSTECKSLQNVHGLKVVTNEKGGAVGDVLTIIC